MGNSPAERITKLTARLNAARADNESRQRVIEILGGAIGIVIPSFKASGTGEEHATACAEALCTKVAAHIEEIRALRGRTTGDFLDRAKRAEARAARQSSEIEHLQKQLRIARGVGGDCGS